MHPFQKLQVVQQAHQFALTCYAKANRIADRSIRWQLQRASQSIAANLVEGAGCEWQAAFARYVAIALASAKETEYHLLFARDAGLLPSEVHASLNDELINLTPRLVRLLTAIRRNTKRRTKPED
jgi:four helix bundle protein